MMTEKKSVQFRLSEIKRIEDELFRELDVYLAMPASSPLRIEQAMKIERLEQTYSPYNALMYI